MSDYPLLRCPVCGERNAVPLQELAVRGRTLERDVVCRHCGADLFLNHERHAPDAAPEWELVTAESLKLGGQKRGRQPG